MLIRLLIILGVCVGMVGCAPKPFIQSEALDRAKAQRAAQLRLLEEEQEHNPRCAFRRYYERALKEDVYAQYMLSMFYLKGVGVPYSLEKSVHWYKKAEQHSGRVYAQYRIGNMFLNPKWFKKDEREALRWITKAAVQGCVVAQNLLGDLYHEGGEFFPQDDKLALHWYKKSAMQHNPIGQYSVGLLYYNGQGVAQDYVMAAVWFHKAAEQGAQYAQYMLSRMYQEGLGLKENRPKAYGWWSLCPEKRLEETKMEYRTLVDPMTPAERIEAYKLSEQYKHNYCRNQPGIVCPEND